MRPRTVAGAAYFAGCVGLAATAAFPAEPAPWAYYALVGATLPTSIAAAPAHYILGILTFGTQDGWAPRAAGFVWWVGVAAVQVFGARALLRSREGGAGRPGRQTGA
jgi:hypothetical protein